MPAIDNLFGNGAIHIADRNKKKPVATLCGQALDKETIRYFESADNFDQATCKVCRKSFFDEAWNGEANSRTDSTNIQDPPVEDQQQGQQEENPAPPARRLFEGLSVPINSHGPQADRQLPEE